MTKPIIVWRTKEQKTQWKFTLTVSKDALINPHMTIPVARTIMNSVSDFLKRINIGGE